MREILFRGKRTDNDEWIFGRVFRLSERLNPFIMLVDRGGISFEVEPETVGQSTGLTDKNGVRIFEGDILAASYPEQTRSVPGVVKFGEFKDVDSDDIYPYNGWHIEVFGHCISIMEPAADGIEIEIIGNIHDNPELMEVEKV